MNNNLLILAALGVAGYFLLSKNSQAAKQQTADQITNALTEYEGAIVGQTVARQPEVALDGSLLYQSLDNTSANPIPQFTVVTRKLMRSPLDLATENGVKFIFTPLSSGDKGKPYKDPNVKVQVIKIFFFNKDTRKEVASYELVKSSDWVPWLRDALESMFAHAFQDACLANPRYNPWANRFEAGAYPCVTRYPVSL